MTARRVVREGVRVGLHEGCGGCMSSNLVRAAHVIVVAHARDDGDIAIVAVVTVSVAVIVTVILLDRACGEHLDFAGENHLEGFASDGLLDARESRAVAPFVQLAAKSIRFELEKAKLACSEQAVTTRRLDVRDRAVDDGRLGWPADLRQVRKQCGKVLCK